MHNEQHARLGNDHGADCPTTPTASAENSAAVTSDACTSDFGTGFASVPAMATAAAAYGPDVSCLGEECKVEPLPRRQAVDAVLRRSELGVGDAQGVDADSVPIRSSRGEMGVRLRQRSVAESVSHTHAAASSSQPNGLPHGSLGSASTPEAMDSEHFVNPSVYSDASLSRPRSPWRQDTTRREQMILPQELRVTRPAGSGSCSASTSKDADFPGSLTMEPHGVVRPTPACRKCLELQTEARTLRAELKKGVEAAREEWRERHAVMEEEASCEVASHADEDQELTRVKADLLAGQRRVSEAESSLHSAREELQAEIAVAEDAGRWQQKTLEFSVELAEASAQSEEAMRRVDLARRNAAEAERQRRELAKQSGSMEAARLRSELEKAAKEREDAAKRFRRANKAEEVALEEEAMVLALQSEETEVAAANSKAAARENADLGKVRQSAGKLRRSMLSQLELLRSELADMCTLRGETQAELEKEQRLRVDEAKRFRAIAADKLEARSELERLRSELDSAEVTLKQFVCEDVAGRGGRQRQRVPSASRALPVRRQDSETDGLPPAVSRALRIDSGGQVADSASSRLFDMLELAKARSGQRKNLSGATEEVRARAQALEDLMAASSASSPSLAESLPRSPESPPGDCGRDPWG